MLNPKTVIVYIEWHDATHSWTQHSVETLGGLSVLEEVGFLVKETEDSITISTEPPQDGEVRMWLTIPKCNIKDLRKTTLGKAFKSTTKEVIK